MRALLRQLIILALIFAAAAWAIDRNASPEEDAPPAARRERPAPKVEVAAAVGTMIERTVSAVGTGRARLSVQLRASDAGRVEEIAFRPGDQVETGDLLIRLDDASERAAVAEAEAEYDETRAAHERALALQQQGRVTGSAYDTARADMLRAEARLLAARAALEDRTLRAPFAGVLGLTDLTVGALAGRDLTITTLEDLSALEVEFSAPERFFAAVAVGDRIRAQTAIHPEGPVDGIVTAVERRVDEATRSFRIRAEIPNEDLNLPSGLFLRVTLVLEARPGIAIPEIAVIYEGGGAYVFALRDDGTVERRRIEAGGRWDGMVEAVSGLAEGERVVTRGLQKMRDGMAVQIAGGPVAGAAAAAPETAAAPASTLTPAPVPASAPAAPAAAAAGSRS